MQSHTDHYLNHGYKKVQGWFSYPALKLIHRIAEIQHKEQLSGGICEIGVHHGRSFILLHLLSRPGEISVAYDLFEDQHENKDQSGQGDRAVFQKNLERFHCDLNQIRIHTTNSLELTSEQVTAQAEGKIRLFSIDGGHEAQVVYHDLALAEESLVPGGVVLLDDFFDQRWPGVAEGTSRYMLSGDSGLMPFAIFEDKVAFTNDQEFLQKYINGLMDLVPEFIIREMQFFGQTCLVIFSSRNHLINRMRQSRVWQNIKNQKAANILRRIFHR